MTELAVERFEDVPLATGRDVVVVRHRVRELAVILDLDLVSQTKVVTAASELARNTVIHGLGGQMTASVVRDASGRRPRLGLRLVFTDRGPGITDVDQAMTHGWSSGTGLGLGLPGSRRLVHDFELDTSPVGTTVTIIFWCP